MAQLEKRTWKKKNGEEVVAKDYQFRAKVNEKRKYISTGCSNLRDAEKFQKLWYEDQKEKKKRTSFNFPETETFLEYLQRPEESWLIPEENPKYNRDREAKGACYGYKHAREVASLLKRVFIGFNDKMGKLPYNKLTKQDAYQFRQRLATYELPPRMKNEAISAVSAAYTFLLFTDNTIEYNPFITLAKFITTEREKAGFTIKQIHLFFNDEEVRRRQEEYEEETKKTLPNFTQTDTYKMFKFALATGMRIGEIRALRYSQFDFQRTLVIDKAFKMPTCDVKQIKLPKFNKIRTIVLSDTALDLVDWHIFKEDYDERQNMVISPKDPNEFVFKDKSGKPHFYSYVYKKWVYFKKFMKIDNRYTIHSIRHSFAGILQHEGVPEFLIANYCGWRNPNESRVQNEYSRTVPTSSSGKQKWTPYKMCIIIDQIFFDREMEEAKGSKDMGHLKPKEEE